MGDLTHEDLFQMKKPVSLFNALSYIGGVVPLDTTSRKQLNRLIETRMLVKSNSKDAMKYLLVSELGNLIFVSITL